MWAARALVLVVVLGAAVGSATGVSRSAVGKICPVTLPNGSAPPGESASPTHHGNGKLWTVLWPNGLIEATPQFVRPDGSIDMKFPWWRAVRGRLVVTGVRLDRKAPPFRAHIPQGYGDDGFQATGLIFPTVGCWKVTGRAGKASLTFVTRVVKMPSPPVAP